MDSGDKISPVANVRRVDRLVWIAIALLFPLLLLALALTTLRLTSKLGKPLPIYGDVADFTLTNQLGRTVSLADLNGKPWVADIIFTRCPGPCLTMTRQMKELQENLPESSTARLVSLTTDPEFDTPPVLDAYARRFNANPGRWSFLTGTKKGIAHLAIDSLKLTAIEKTPEERKSPEDLFIHSTIFVVVDRQARLRGVYETTGEGVEPPRIRSQILAALRRLEREK